MNLLLRAPVYIALHAVAILAAGLACQPAAAATASTCSAKPVPADSQDVTCTLEPSTAGAPLRFVAVFGGSHDDTRIKLEATLDGAPLTCDAASKTSLFAEDGIVKLDCGFRAPVATTAPVLKVALTVHHAQYVSSSLDRE